MRDVTLLRPVTLGSLPGGRYVLGFPDGSGIVTERRGINVLAAHLALMDGVGSALGTVRSLEGRMVVACIAGKVQLWTGKTRRAILSMAQARALGAQLLAASGR